MSTKQWWNYADKGEQKSMEKNPSQSQFVHQKSETDWPGIEPGLCSDWLVTNHVGHGKVRLPSDNVMT